MLKNILKMAYRSLIRNKLFSFINILGLATALGCCITVFIFIYYILTMNDFHENKDKIFLIGNIIERDGKETLWGDSPVPLGPMMKQDLPQIQYSVRVENGSGTFKYGSKVFDESVRYVDADFLNMFSFPLKYGNKNSLETNNSVIVSQEFSEKYFESKNPLGEQIIFLREDKSETFLIGGVAEPFPSNKSFSFNVLIPYEKTKVFIKPDMETWETWTGATFIQLYDISDLGVVSASFNKYVKLHNDIDADWPLSKFTFNSFTTLSTEGEAMQGCIVGGTQKVYLIALFSISMATLFLACFNYTNISIASISTRFKEIGVRKVLGSSKKGLILQFLSENIVSCLIALLIGLAFAQNFLIPSFNSMFDTEMALDFSGNIIVWVFLTGILLISAIVSGGYPAFFVSRFQPVKIFRNKQAIQGKFTLTRLLLMLQFFITFFCIVFAFVGFQNSTFQKNIDWGYDQEQVIMVDIKGVEQFQKMRDAIVQHPDIEGIAGGEHHFGWSMYNGVAEIGDKKIELIRMNLGMDYIQTMGTRLQQGRLFEKQYSSDLENSVVINAKFKENLGVDNIIGKKITMKEKDYTVVGVVENFHFQTFSREIEPLVINLAKEDKYQYMVVKTKPGKSVLISEYLQNTWKKIIPDQEYSGRFQDEVFSNYFRLHNNILKVQIFIGIVTLIIAAMGLFGLVSSTISRRVKEIGIRKVLGAKIGNILYLVNRDFIKILIISTVIALPAAIFLINKWLESQYAYYKPVSADHLFISFLFMVTGCAVTLSVLVYKAAIANPVESLRDE